MKQEDIQALDSRKNRARRSESKALSPLLTVWGVQWIISSLLDFAEQWYPLEQAKMVTLGLAALASLGILVRTWLNASKSSDQEKWPLFALPAILILASVLLLEYVGAISPYFSPVFCAFILSICYVQLGLFLGKRLIYLGLWLFMLTAIMGVWYLGYSTIVLEGLGGLSLLACVQMLKR